MSTYLLDLFLLVSLRFACADSHPMIPAPDVADDSHYCHHNRLHDMQRSRGGLMAEFPFGLQTTCVLDVVNKSFSISTCFGLMVISKRKVPARTSERSETMFNQVFD